MPDPQKTVFISYRREPSRYVARSIFQELYTRGYDVFLDVEKLDSGKFATIIFNQIAARAHFVIILAPGTLDRCVQSNDMLRREIEQAVALKRNIIPVFVEGFNYDDIERFLNGNLATLGNFNGLRLYHDYFKEAIDRLCNDFFQEQIDGIINPAPSIDTAIVTRKIQAAEHEPVPTNEQLSAEEYFNRGNTYYTLKNYEAALGDFTTAIHLDPQYAHAYNNRGIVHRKLKNYEAALADYDTTIDLAPLDAVAYFNRGITHHDLKNYDAALADYNEAIRLDQQYTVAYINRGNTYRALKDYEAALADFNNAISLEPEDAMIYNNRGNTYYRLNNYKAALADFEQALLLDPQYTTARNSREMLCRKMQNLSE